MPDKFKYKAFISYSHTDKKWARWLHRNLEFYRTPKRLQGIETEYGPVPARLTPIFRDREDLATSHNLSTSIQSALDQSENLIVICSPKCAASKWTNQEIELFKKLGRPNRIFCLIVDGDPTATIAEQNCFPPALLREYDAAGNLLDTSAEPIAADVREFADGKSRARLKIIAGLLNVDLDHLRQRELQRRHRRMLVITATSVFASIFTITLAVNAMLARTEAEQRRFQAEELLSFMVGDLRSSLETIGRLDLLEGVGSQAMAYFETVNIRNLTDNELLRQSQVMTQLGEIRVSQLQYNAALASFTEAYERSAELLRSEPGNGEKLFNRSQAEFWLGFVHWRNGSRVDARNWLTQYRESALQLFALDPSREDWLREVVYAHHNLAVLDLEMGDIETAKTGFVLEVEMLDALIANGPGDDLLRSRADALSFLGDGAILQGEITTALDYYAQSLTTIDSLFATNPDDARWIDDMAFAQQLVAETTAMTGDLEIALLETERATILFGRLAAIDPENLNWRRAGTRPRITKGNLLLARNNLDQAESLAMDSITILEDLVNQGNADHNVYFQLADAYRLSALVNHSRGNLQAALEAADTARRSLEIIDQADRLTEERIGLLASIHIVRGLAYRDLENGLEAGTALQLASELLENRIAESNSPYLLDPWVRVLSLTEQPEKAREISDALTARRYIPLLAWDI